MPYSAACLRSFCRPIQASSFPGFSGLFRALFRRRRFLDSTAYLEPYSGVSFLRPGGLFREAFSVVLSSGGGARAFGIPPGFSVSTYNWLHEMVVRRVRAIFKVSLQADVRRLG